MKLNNTAIRKDLSDEVWNLYIFHKFKQYEDWLMYEQFLTEKEAEEAAKKLAKKHGSNYTGYLK